MFGCSNPSYVCLTASSFYTKKKKRLLLAEKRCLCYHKAEAEILLKSVRNRGGCWCSQFNLSLDGGIGTTSRRGPWTVTCAACRLPLTALVDSQDSGPKKRPASIIHSRIPFLFNSIQKISYLLSTHLTLTLGRVNVCAFCCLSALETWGTRRQKLFLFASLSLNSFLFNSKFCRGFESHMAHV